MEPDPGHGRTRRHIAIVVPGFVGERDEPGIPAVVDLVERLAATHDVEVVALRHPTARPPYRVAGVRVRALGLGAGGGAVARARVLARGVRAVVTIHRRWPLDLVHGLWADEAGAVATLADGLVLVVRAGVTTKPAIAHAVSSLGAARLLGMVFNESTTYQPAYAARQ